MTERAYHHHLALRVSDIECSTRFYTEVFGGQLLWDEEFAPGAVPTLLSREPDVGCRVRFIQLARGGAVELHEFQPAEPLPPAEQLTAGVMHLCIGVDDVPEAVRQARAHGGGGEYELHRWRDYHFTFLEDPDGYVIELVDVDVETATALMAQAGGVEEADGMRRTLIQPFKPLT